VSSHFHSQAKARLFRPAPRARRPKLPFRRAPKPGDVVAVPHAVRVRKAPAPSLSFVCVASTSLLARAVEGGEDTRLAAVQSSKTSVWRTYVQEKT